MFSRLIADIASCAWGLKDRDYSSFLVSKAHAELVLDRDSLDRLVLVRIKGIIQHAQQTSSYYAKIFKDYGLSVSDIKALDDIKRFPCLTRDVLRERLPELISGGAILTNWRKSTTGGTTNAPVTFYCDDKALWQKRAFSKAIDCWYGRRTGDRVAYLWGAPQDIADKQTFGMRLRNLTYQHSLMLPSAPLDDAIMEHHLHRLNKWQPTYLQAYPTPLYEFCLFMSRKRLKVPTLRSVSVTAETLLPDHRKFIEDTLGFRIFNWYGSRELARVASECECHEGLHINEPCVFVEIEPDPVLPNGYGHLIITDLLNKATPLVRYRTGDLARFMPGNCSCGRALHRVESIAGRVTDLITLQNGRKIRYSNTMDSSKIKELQIIQKTYSDFIVKYVKGPDFEPRVLESFCEKFCIYLDNQVTVIFEELNKIPRERSGKVRLVINELSSKNVVENVEQGGMYG
jgi:phenylacetate-CoA ligase